MLDTLREEHRRALERDQRQADEERRRVDVWIADLKKGFEIEKRQLEQKLTDIEPRVPSPEVEGGVPTAPEERPEITATVRTESDTQGTVTGEGEGIVHEPGADNPDDHSTESATNPDDRT